MPRGESLEVGARQRLLPVRLALPGGDLARFDHCAEGLERLVPARQVGLHQAQVAVVLQAFLEIVAASRG